MSDFKIGSIDFRTPGTGYLVNGPIKKVLQPKLIVRQNPFSLVDNQVANVFNGIVEWTIPMMIVGSGTTFEDAGADFAAKISDLNDVLTAEPNTNTLIDSLDYEGSPETAFQMVRSNPLLISHEELTDKRHVWQGQIVVRTYPFGVGSPVDLTPGDVTFVGMLALSDVDLEGDLPAPLTLTVAGAEIDNVVAAICPAGAVLSHYYFSISSPAVHGPGQIYAHTVTPAGRFRVLANLATWVTGTRVGIGQDGASAAYQTRAIAGGTMALYDLGEFASNGGTELQVFVSAGSAALYNLVIVPVDVSCVSAWGLSGATTITFGADANSAPGQTIGNGLTCPKDSPSLLVVVDPPDTVATVSASYSPLLYGWGS